MRDYTWMARAACKGQTDLFFPAGGSLEPARKLCADCPVQFQCEEYGHEGINLPAGTNLGLWGGKTPAELLDDEVEQTFIPDRECPECGGPIPMRGGKGRPRQYCSRRCYRLVWERRCRPTSMNSGAA